MEKKINVDLCEDHFERLVDGSVCATCPSNVENEAAVRALASINSRSDDDKLRAIISELHSIRRVQKGGIDKLTKLEHKVIGNGRPGLSERITIIETRLAVAEKSKGVWIAIGTAVLSALLGIIGLIIK